MDLNHLKRLVDAAEKATRENDPLVAMRDAELKTYLYENARKIISMAEVAEEAVKWYGNSSTDRLEALSLAVSKHVATG